jgi:hypothetical protein
LTDVDLFLHVLRQNEDILASLPVITFELNGKNQTNSFTTLLQEKASHSENPSFIRNMIVLDLSKHLNADHFYVLDDHLNSAGHIVVADLIYRTMKESNII